MITLRRLADAHPFRCACVEGAAGDLATLMAPRHPPHVIEPIDPLPRVAAWRTRPATPLLALHSRADRVVPVACIERFTDALARHYRAHGLDPLAPPALVTLKTWPSTGAPDEHNGFGQVAHEAKATQLEFLERWLAPQPPAHAF